MLLSFSTTTFGHLHFFWRKKWNYFSSSTVIYTNLIKTFEKLTEIFGFFEKVFLGRKSDLEFWRVSIYSQNFHIRILNQTGLQRIKKFQHFCFRKGSKTRNIWKPIFIFICMRRVWHHLSSNKMARKKHQPKKEKKWFLKIR